MTDNTEFVSVRLPRDVADWLRDYATANNLVRADKPNMGGSIIAVVRERMQGLTISNIVRHSDNVDIEAMVEAMVNIKIAALRDSINLEFVDIKNELAAIATNRTEATAPAKKPLILSPQLRAVAMQKVTAA